jgi:hypothetical protein
MFVVLCVCFLFQVSYEKEYNIYIQISSVCVAQGLSFVISRLVDDIGAVPRGIRQGYDSRCSSLPSDGVYELLSRNCILCYVIREGKKGKFSCL